MELELQLVTEAPQLCLMLLWPKYNYGHLLYTWVPWVLCIDYQLLNLIRQDAQLLLCL